jgi:hypothetical protein
MRKRLLLIPAVFAISMGAGIQAQERIQMEGTEITGNKELPRVLYIVPWKTAERFEIDTPPIDSIMERRLELLERSAFRRTIRYHEAIFSKATLE